MGWVLLKSMEGPKEEVAKRFGDTRTEKEKKVYNETELMYSIIRGGGQASLRWV
jgi:hypothetical protein